MPTHGARHDVFKDAHVREQVELLEHHADTAAHVLKRVGGDLAGLELDAEHVDGAGLETLQAVDAAQESALAAAGRADDGGHLAAADSEGDATKDLEVAVVLDEAGDLDHATTLPFSWRDSSQRARMERGMLIRR
jgi:hypothetical protein